MGVNSLSLLVMIISYATIIYKVRESSRAMAKHQLMACDLLIIKSNFFLNLKNKEQSIDSLLHLIADPPGNCDKLFVVIRLSNF